ncbi:Sodium channel protein 60E [Symbiodinium microadriaticum]|uniref:Sodium channel protein 60E n=1 Tax=Symbiodinium microadriaticum TaxID=2951 RepID=A0A1Q9CMR1_SYMMI|nr:Sodium channel protein 60E [Symbiodinium microadriaticum]CAE7345352.1 NaCP60E [Symbiodinium sp. KB8]CAE7810834.1 NaCP60E [Symbiodinium microadriaticum]
MAQDCEDGVSSGKHEQLPSRLEADADPLVRSIDSIIQRRQEELFVRLCDTLEGRGANRHSSMQAYFNEFALPGESPPLRRISRFSYASPTASARTASKEWEHPASASSLRSDEGPRPSRRSKVVKKRWQVNAMPLLEEEDYEALADARSKQRAMRTAERSEQNEEDAAIHGMAQRLVMFVSSKWFEGTFAAVIITNCFFLGISLEAAAQDLSSELPLGFKVVDYIYATLFALELVLKVCVQGKSFFCFSADRSALFWNYLDVVIVGTSIFELVFDLILAFEFDESAAPTQTRLLRIIRVIRVLRVMRVVKVVKFISALTSLVTSILSTLKSLLWSLVLLLMVMYVFAILFTDTVIGHVKEVGQEGQTELLTYFGSLHLSMHTLFRSVTGGLDWGEMADHLIEIDWVWGYFFTGFVAFSYFAVLNVMTAVFCQRAIESAEQDEQNILQRFLDDQRRYRHRIEQLFSRFDGLERDGAITLSEMEQFFNDEEVCAMFQSLDLTARDSWTLFKLLDEEGNGDINLSEFIDGCLRLRGPAKALDIACVMDESRRIKRKVMITEERLYNMEALVGELSSTFESKSVRKQPVAPQEDPPLLSSLGSGGFLCGASAGGQWMQHDESLHLPDVPFDVGPDLGRSRPPQRILRGRDTGLMNAKGSTEEPHFPDLLYDLGPYSFPLKQLSF